LLLSDAQLTFSKALNLPTFEVEGKTLIKRLTMILWQGNIEKVFYPVFPPHKSAQDVVAWLAEYV
ncbi:MAG: redoxin family protein, partial [Deinococcota bacterium]|nr:redoxin family protein [Deinococcota bacterium]